MMINLTLANLNYWGIIAALAVSFVTGMTWYAPAVLGKIWMKELGKKMEDCKGQPMGLIYATTAVLNIILGLALSLLIGTGDYLLGLIWGFLISIAIVAPTIGINYLFEGKSLKLFFINAGYWVVTLSLMGLVIGLL